MAEDKDKNKKKDIKDAPKDKFVYARDSRKSLRQIADDVQEEVKKQNKEEKPTEDNKPLEENSTTPPEKKDDNKEGVVSPPASPPVDAEKIKEEAIKTAREEAQKAAKQAFEDEMKKIAENNKSLEEKQKDADELISVFEKEGRLPKDYKEVLSEASRIARVTFEQQQKRAQEEAKKAADAKKAEEEKVAGEQKKAEEEKMTAITNKINTDLNDLYEAKVLPRPPEKYNESDKNQKETDELLKFGIELNQKRVKEGLPPIDSVAKIYYMHYKPYLDAKGKKSGQPPGADAPVAGATQGSKTDGAKDKYVYARDHKKSFQQLKDEAIERARNRQ